MEGILKTHKKAKSKSAADIDPAKQEFIDQMMSAGADPKKDIPDLKKDVTSGVPPRQSQQDQPRRGPGRPKGTTSKSKSPARPAIDHQKTAETIVEELGRGRLIKKLKAYLKFFPGIVGSSLSGFDPRTAPIEQLRAVVQGCKDAIGDELTMSSVPGGLETLLDKIETAAVTTGRASGDKRLKHLILLNGFAKKAREDPAIMGDLMLIGIDLMSLIPTNPYYRLAFNIFKAASATYEENLMTGLRGDGSTTSVDPDSERFKDF